MNAYKIAGWIGALLAILSAFVPIPYAGAIMAIAGVVVGIGVVADHYVRVIASAIALNLLANAFGGIPGLGPYLTAILSGFGVVAAGAAILIIVRNMWTRLKP